MRCYNLYPKYAKYKEPRSAHNKQWCSNMGTYYCKLLHIIRFISSFESVSLVFLCLFLQSSFVRRCMCTLSIMFSWTRDIFEDGNIILTLAIDLIWAPNHIEAAEADG